MNNNNKLFENDKKINDLFNKIFKNVKIDLNNIDLTIPENQELNQIIKLRDDNNLNNTTDKFNLIQKYFVKYYNPIQIINIFKDLNIITDKYHPAFSSNNTTNFINLNRSMEQTHKTQLQEFNNVNPINYSSDYTPINFNTNILLPIQQSIQQPIQQQLQPIIQPQSIMQLQNNIPLSINQNNSPLMYIPVYIQSSNNIIQPMTEEPIMEEQIIQKPIMEEQIIQKPIIEQQIKDNNTNIKEDINTNIKEDNNINEQILNLQKQIEYLMQENMKLNKNNFCDCDDVNKLKDELNELKNNKKDNNDYINSLLLELQKNQIITTVEVNNINNSLINNNVDKQTIIKYLENKKNFTKQQYIKSNNNNNVKTYDFKTVFDGKWKMPLPRPTVSDKNYKVNINDDYSNNYALYN